MESVRLQNQDLEEFEDYIDAQNGGPGRGWMKIVATPAKARKAIDQGKLAVVKGIELSRVLDCGETVESDPEPQCTPAFVDAGLDELQELGITSFFPVHKFDNAFGGTKMDSGALGPVVNAGNFYKTHHFWDVEQCSGPGEDREQPTAPIASSITGLIDNLGFLPPSVNVPLYGPPPHCNQRGLTPIGAYLLHEMVERKFIIEVDHMNEVTADMAMDIVESHQYPGVINSHSDWSSDPTIQRIRAVGGVAGFNKNPNTGTGLGSDINGLSSQPGPGSTPINYPFRSSDRRVYFDRETYGDRTFDFNTDGVATYGLWIDWIEAQRVAGKEARLRALNRSAEDYLRMWAAARKHQG